MNDENKQIIDTTIFNEKKEKQEDHPEDNNAVNDDNATLNTETEQAPSFEETINEIKAEYEAKIERLKASNEKALEERNRVIKQLLNEENTAPKLSIVDKINSKRNYKKW